MSNLMISVLSVSILNRVPYFGHNMLISKIVLINQRMFSPCVVKWKELKPLEGDFKQGCA